jgi:uncharacterized repeat protein (TIGR04076 family)
VLRMIKPHRVRISVLRRFSPSEVFEKNPVTPVSRLEACELFRDGQEFIVGENLKMPEGFCTSAWVSIYGSKRRVSPSTVASMG